MIWHLPETLDITVTLFKVGSSKPGGWSQAGHVTNVPPPQEPTAEEFEDKDWTFLIENVSQSQPRRPRSSGRGLILRLSPPPCRSPGAAPKCWRPLTST